MILDLKDINDIEGSASLIGAEADRLTDSGADDFAVAELRRAAGSWVDSVAERLDSLTAGDALTAVDCLDAVHRVAYGRTANPDWVGKYIHNAFEAHIRGDKTVDRYLLLRMVSRELRRRNRSFVGRPLQWRSTCIDRWHKEFLYGTSTARMERYDRIERVGILLDSDLWVFETKNEERYKRRLFDNHRAFLDPVPDTDIRTLTATGRLLSSASIYLSPESFSTYRSALRRALLLHPFTNRYLRQSLIAHDQYQLEICS